jgi:hypothetical protein
VSQAANWKLALGLLGAGAAVLFISEAEALRVLGALTAIGGIVAAVFAIATPEFLAVDPEEENGED